MSTLSATNIKNASSGSNNIVLGTSGQTTVNGDLLFNSGYGSAATAYGCRAWVNFNGTGTVSTNQTIRGSGNVTSVFKNGTGDYTVYFTTAMPDANYTPVFGTDVNIPTSGNGNMFGIYNGGTMTTTALRVSNKTPNSPTTPQDTAMQFVAIFR